MPEIGSRANEAVTQANRILVMRHDTIFEEGTHAELLEMQGYYEELHRHSQGSPSSFKIGHKYE